MFKLYLTTIEVCNLFDISKSTLFRWEKEGAIPPVQRDIRGHRVYTDKEIHIISKTLRGRLKVRYQQAVYKNNLKKVTELQQINSLLKLLSGDVIGLYELNEMEVISYDVIKRLLNIAAIINDHEDPIFNGIMNVLAKKSKNGMQKYNFSKSSLLRKQKGHIFISYAREDLDKAERLYNQLLDGGFKPWMDTRDILAGEKWEDKIVLAIEASNIFICCLSHNSVNKRGMLQKEISIALDNVRKMLDSDIYLIPLRFEECDVPSKLHRFQWIDYYDENSWDRLKDTISEAIYRLQKQ